MRKFEKILAKELGIEFKAAIYFYTIIFYYFVYQLLQGSSQVDILVLIEMMATTYIMGYIQVFLLGNFDEAEHVNLSVVVKVVCGAFIYTCVSFFGKWFDRNLVITGVYFVFMLFCYVCAYWAYSVKRVVSTREMNEELNTFKQQKIKEEVDVL